MKCIQGHDIIDGSTCSEGHPREGLNAPATAAVESITITSQALKELVQSAIQGALSAKTNETPQQHRPRTKRPDPIRPTIDLECSESDWDFFIEEWERYKRQVALQSEELTDEILSTCSTQLRKELFDFVSIPVIRTLNGESLLAKIKSLAVKGKNKAVHRKEFYSMVQAPGEPIQTFVGKLKSKAAHCSFTFKCTSP